MQTNMKAVFIIVNAGFSEEAVEIARNQGAGGATVINSRGTGNSFHKNFLGISYDPEKEMILTLVTEEVAVKVMDTIKETFGINNSANGICFSMPVDNMTMLSSYTTIDEGK